MKKVFYLVVFLTMMSLSWRYEDLCFEQKSIGCRRYVKAVPCYEIEKDSKNEK